MEGTPGYIAAVAAAKTLDPPPPTLVKSLKLSNTLVERSVAGIIGFRGALECINLADAWSGYTADRTSRKAMGLVGASADLGALLVEVGGSLLKSLPETALKLAGAGLGIISGICDCIEFGITASEASDKHDYDAAVGMGIASSGAALITVGSGLALYGVGVAGAASVESSAAAGSLLGSEVLGALTLGRLGPCIGILGAALVGTGALWWRLANDNDYEQFAKHCFLGKAYGQGTLKPNWTDIRFPADDIEDERKALFHLLSSFRVSLDPNPTQRAGVPPYRLTIVPGCYGEADLFQVYLEHRLDEPVAVRIAAVLQVHISTGEL